VWAQRTDDRERPGADRGQPGAPFWRRFFGGPRTPRNRGTAGVRAGQISRQQAMAYILVPLLGILVLGASGLWSAAFFSSSSKTIGTPPAASALEVETPSSPQGAWPSVQAAQSSTQPASPASASAALPSNGAAPVDPALAVSAADAAAKAALGSSTPVGKGTITIETFGYSFGGPPEGSRFVADVRNIEAGPFSPYETGLMEYVRARVMTSPAAEEWLSVFTTKWAPLLEDGDKVAIGCSAGHHRSVTLAVLFAEDLRAQGYTVNLVHRDILRTY
jgi:hypothetical protein